MPARQPAHRRDGALRPGAHRPADLRGQAGGRGPVGGERRAPGARALRRRRRMVRRRGDPDDGGGSTRRAQPHERVDPSARGHREEPSCRHRWKAATFLKVMATYRDLLQGLRAEIDEIQPPEAAALADAPVFVDVREQDEWDVEHIPGALHLTRGRLESRIERAVPDREAPIVVYCESGNALALRRPDARGARLRERAEPRRRDRRVEARRVAAGDGRRAHARAAAPLQPARPDSRGRRGGAAEAPRLADPPDRRGRARLPGLALPRSRGRRHARHRRRRRRRRDEPPAPDRPFDRAARRGEGRSRRPTRSPR